MDGLRTATPTLPQRGTAADKGGAGTLTRYTGGTDCARPEYGTLARHEYGLLAPMGTSVDPADAGDLWREKGHDATRGVAGQDQSETEEGDETCQSTPPAHGMRGDNDERWRPPKRLRALNACGR